MASNAAKLREIGKPFELGPDPRRNTKGRRPKTLCMTTCLEELQLGIPSKVVAKWRKKGELTGAQRSALSMQKEIEDGSVSAFRETADRVEGKVTEHTDVTSGGQPITQTVNVVSQKAKEGTEAVMNSEGTE